MNQYPNAFSNYKNKGDYVAADEVVVELGDKVTLELMLLQMALLKILKLMSDNVLVGDIVGILKEGEAKQS